MIQAELRDAAAEGDLKRCRELLAAGHGVDLPALWTPLQAACTKGYLDVCQLLIEAGADVNTGDNTPFMIAADNEDVELCKLLIDVGADVSGADSYGNTPLMRMAQRGNVTMCQFLIDSGVDVNVARKSGWTALLLAVAAGSLDAVKCLLAAGADATTPRACEGFPPLTAFQMAIRMKSVKVAEFFLMEVGEDLAQRTVGGKTLCQLAGKSVAMKQLLQSIKATQAIESALPRNDSGANNQSLRNAPGAGVL